MASRLNPYIGFDNNARQAMEFYQAALGGELVFNTFGEMGNQDNPDGIMHAMLETPSGFTLMASDSPPEVQYTPGANISVSLSGEDEAELRGYWDKLSEGGQVAVPLEKQMWGDVFGMLIDQFGIGWMVNITAPTEG
ncbi:MAG TPA: VOC family protein [Nocardioidaceae bacterium]|nr:VOC family protein [Nocardioidaceae bacterium]